MIESSDPRSEKTANASFDAQYGDEEAHNLRRDNTDNDPQVELIARYGVIGLGPFLSKLFELGVEARGVERVPEEMRDNTHFWSKYV